MNKVLYFTNLSALSLLTLDENYSKWIIKLILATKNDFKSYSSCKKSRGYKNPYDKSHKFTFFLKIYLKQDTYHALTS